MAETPNARLCKICTAYAPLHGVVDFNRSCEAGKGRLFPLRGVPVWYYRCQQCGFLFTTQFDDWAHEDWLREVYNEGYADIDPDGFDGTRARNNAASVLSVARGGRLLDYGGGDGALARILREDGIDAVSWDALTDEPRPEGLFDIVTSFEVFEHTPTPAETARDALSFLSPGGSLLFTTLTLDDLAPQFTSHSYIAPRNGHVSIHTRKSLDILFRGFGLVVEHIDQLCHSVMKSPVPPA